MQSGKTSQVFGVIAKAADEGFNIFILLTTDNVYLQRQTFERAVLDMQSFNVCNETDEIRFRTLASKKPTLLIIKKNVSVLKTWRTRLAVSKLFPGNPVFIVDDEADAASLNTHVNRQDVSTINRQLQAIRSLSKCGVYLQVTGTLHALILQTIDSGWKPEFVERFLPGTGYLGGSFFFSEDNVPPSVVLTDDQEIDDLLNDDEFAVNGLMKALMSFLISTAHLTLIEQSNVCNFVVHPSFKVGTHELIAEKVGEYLNHLVQSLSLSRDISLLREVYDNLNGTMGGLIDYDTCVDFIQSILKEDAVKIQVMNSNSPVADYENGINIIVGGNSLGRGITFPKLQTTYYCRTAKIPQADTVWQHCRMFGYDRVRNLVRAYMPPRLYRALSEINSVNSSIFKQAERNGGDNLKLYHSKSIRPTRRQVIDKSAVSIIAGGVNYFPFAPVNRDIPALDRILSLFDNDSYYTVNLKLMVTCLEYVENQDLDEWSNTSFIDCTKAYMADYPSEQGILIVRRNRNITKGTGTMLSQNDRSLGQQFPDKIVLTLYKVTGSKGWDGQQLWIPNIKYPDTVNFYDVHR